MRTIRLLIEFDGTAYAGWQLQPNALSIQQVVEEALAGLLGEQVRVHGSGRTDAGVHARGMVAAFRTTKSIPVRAFTYGLNNILPSDIVVRDASEAAPDFDPRGDAKGKHYRYTLLCTPHRSPLSRLYAWHLRDQPDLNAMRAAAAHFVGEKDFAAFCASGSSVRTTVRTMHSVDIIEEGSCIHIDVRGGGFLRNMVRIMAGTLVDVGLGKMSVDAVPRLFCGQTRGDAGITAPPQGLCLMEVFY